METIFGTEVEEWLLNNEDALDSFLADLGPDSNSSSSEITAVGESSSTPNQQPTSSTPTSASRPFAAIKSDVEVELARNSGIPEKTSADTKYCVGVWEAWSSYRRQQNGDSIQSLEQLSREELNYWLTRFILEVSNIAIAS